MKYYIITILYILGFVVTANTQVQTKISGEFPFQLHQINDVNVQLTDASLQIVKENNTIYSHKINGKKTFQTSPLNNYFLIVNFDFIDEDGDYPVTLFIFDVEGKLSFTHELPAPFDLPHPLFAINNEGVVAYFEPINFFLTIVNEEVIIPIRLENNVEFEMEKAFFISFNDAGIYVLTTIGQADIEGRNNENTFFYYINYPSNIVTKQIINFSVPTALTTFDDEVIISGIRFENLQPVMETRLYSNAVELKKTINGFSYQQLVKTNGGYTASYAGTLYNFDDNFNEVSRFTIGESGLIRNIQEENGLIALLFQLNQEYSVYLFDSGLNVIHQQKVEGFTGRNTLSMDIMNNMIIIYTDYKTQQFTLGE